MCKIPIIHILHTYNTGVYPAHVALNIPPVLHM